MRGFIRTIVLTVLLAYTSGLQAQSYQVKRYNSQSGLNRTNINDIIDDQQGYVWLATESGIVRFDGMNFIELGMPADSLWTKGIRKLYRYENTLYAFCYQKGLYRINLNNYAVTLLEPGAVADLLQTSPSTLLLLFSNGLLKKIVDGVPIKQVRLTQLVHNHALTRFRREVYVSLLNQGIYRLDTATLSLYGLCKLTTEAFEGEFEQRGAGLFYIASGVLFHLDMDRRSYLKSAIFSKSSEDLNAFKPWEDSLQYFLAHHKYFGTIRNGKKNILPLHGIENFDLRSLFVADQNNVLIGTNQGLIQVNFNRVPFTNINDNHLDYGDALRVRRKILSTPDNHILLLGSPTSFLVEEKAGQKVYYPLNKERFNIYDAVWVGDKVYAGTEGQGLVVINVHQKTTERFRHPLLQQEITFTSLDYDSTQGVLLASSLGKLYILELQSGKLRSVQIADPGAYIMDILRDPVTQRILLATSMGIVVLDSSYAVLKDLTGKEGGKLANTKISDLIIRRNTRELWVAHDNGCTVIDADTYQFLYALPQGVFLNPKVVSILQGPIGRMWMGTYNGIIGYNPATGKYVRLGKLNSLINEEFNYKSAAVLPSGHLIFGGLNGYDIIESELLSFERKVTGRITGYQRIQINRTEFTNSGLAEKFIQFDTENEILRLYLAADQSFQANKLTFEYNFDNEPWISLANNAILNIYFLRQGYHTLNLRAFDEYGAPVDFAPIRLLSRVPFYKTPLFLWTLLIISFFSLVLYVLSVVWSKKREDQLKEKLSMDLHDEVGTVLTRAMYVAQYGEVELQGGLLKKYLSEALNSLRTFINTMNLRTANLNMLIDDLREMMANTLVPLHIQGAVHAQIGENVMISGELYRDLRLVLYELQSNMLRYSRGTQLDVTLSVADRLLHVKVCDNGVLTNVADIMKKGNGIGNIQKRVSRNKGIVIFALAPAGHGLEVNMEFPL